MQALRIAGCATIIGIDLDEDRLQLARKLGATHAVKADAPDLLESVRALTGGRGVDASFEVVGMSPTLKTAIDCVRKGGSVTLVGNLQRRHSTASGILP